MKERGATPPAVVGEGGELHNMQGSADGSGSGRGRGRGVDKRDVEGKE